MIQFESEQSPLPRDTADIQTAATNGSKKWYTKLSPQVHSNGYDDNLKMKDEESSGNISMSGDVSSKSNTQVAPDGGYGWVIVGCSFMCIVNIDGIGSTYSLFLPELNNYFETIPTISSMGNSLFFGTLLLMGMPTSYLIDKFGCRKVAFFGACLAAGGLALSSLATSIWMFLPTFGIIGGMGIGMFYLSSVILVNSYFNRKRGIAQGIVTSGSGFGILILSQLMKVLLDAYGWQGAVMIISGIVSQLCICALLMRPLYVNSTSGQLSFERNGEHLSEKNKRNKSGKIEERWSAKTVFPEKNLDALRKDIKTEGGQGKIVDHKLSSREVIQAKNFQNESVYSSVPNIPSETISSDNLFQSSQYMSVKCIKSSSGDASLRRHEFNPLLKKDIFYSGSTNKLTNNDTKIDEIDFQEKRSSRDLSIKIGFCDRSLLTNRAFILLAIGAHLTQMAQYIPMVFLGDYALQIGLNRADIAIILSVFGVVNTIGRLLAGVLTNVPRLTPLCICNIGNYMCALTLFLFPLCTAFWTLCVFAVFHALFVGFFPPMQPLMTLDYLGLDRLTPAFGLITFVKGPAAIFGPPIAGNLYQQTQNYAVSNAFAGGLFFVSAFVQTLIPFCHKNAPYCKKENELSIETESFIEK